MEVRDETAPYCWPTSFNDFYPIDARAGAAGRFTISASDRDDNAPTQRHRADERLSTMERGGGEGSRVTEWAATICGL